MRSLALVALVACAAGRPAELASNFQAVRLIDGRVVDAAGEPYSGMLVARDAEVQALASLVLQGTALAEHGKAARMEGLIVSLPIVRGVPSGRATLRLDLRAAKLDNELARARHEFAVAIAKQIAPILIVGEATFRDGKLDGDAVLYGPGLDAKRLVTARFAGGALDGTVTEYADTGRPRREHQFAHGVRAGRQKEYFANGALASEVGYVDGVPHGEGRRLYKSTATRERTRYDKGRLVSSEAWFPSGARRWSFTVDADGRKTGTAWYSTGAVATTWDADGAHEVKPDGVIVEYHENGAVETRTAYADGVRHGTREVFYADGTPRETASYERGQQTGSHKKWWNNGTLALDETWRDGRRAGPSKSWYASGQPWTDETYANGAREGRSRKWWKNGTLAHDLVYERDRVHGAYRTFYDTGVPWAVGLYEHGKPRGVFLRWWPNGRLGYELHHARGRPHGRYRRWHANGQPRTAGTYANGGLEGELTSWDEQGAVASTQTYRGGVKL